MNSQESTYICPLILLTLTICFCTASVVAEPVYLDPSQPIESRRGV